MGQNHQAEFALPTRVYRVAAAEIRRWAERKSLARLRDITPAMLDEWRGEWSPNAEERDDRMNRTLSSSFSPSYDTSFAGRQTSN